MGVFLLASSSAFEALAVTAVMPLAARELRATNLFAAAFSLFAAAGIVGTIAAGELSQRAGVGRVLLVSSGLFLAGLVGAAGAPAMTVLLAARVVQGLGSGGLGATIYVLVSEVVPEQQRKRVFALLSAAWVLPALAGPALAGALAQLVSWRLVFVSVIPLVITAVGLLAPPVLHRSAAIAARSTPRPRRILLAAGVAACLFAMQSTATVHVPVVVGLQILLAVLAIAGMTRLLPRKTLTARPGLPAVIGQRALLGAGFTIASAYLPYYIEVARRGSAVVAGAVVATGALTWALGAQLQARPLSGWSDRRCISVGSFTCLTGLALLVLAVACAEPSLTVVIAWGIGGLGMGLATPRTATALLRTSAPEKAGTNSAAFAVAESFLGALALNALTAIQQPPSALALTAVASGATLVVAATLLAPRSEPPPHLGHESNRLSRRIN